MTREEIGPIIEDIVAEELAVISRKMAQLARQLAENPATQRASGPEALRAFADAVECAGVTKEFCQ